MARKEFRVTYSRRGWTSAKRRVFGQRTSLNKFLDGLETPYPKLAPLDRLVVESRQVGRWEIQWEKR